MTPAEVLAGSGPFAGLIEGYAPRDQQIEMAGAIADALSDGESLICEAGTGTGKTLAYLVPAIQSGLKVIISTGTRALQDQLYSRDAPLARQALGIPVNVALLKGRANYLCLHRLFQAQAGHRDLDPKSLSMLGVIREWSQQSESGDLAEFPDLPEESRLRALVTSTAENCLGQSCDQYEDCFVFEARRRATAADITIVNHHLYLADMGLRELGYGELLPPADAVIFDEAHQLPALAARFFSRTQSSHQWFDLARDCRAAYFAEAADLPEFLESVDRMEGAVRDLRLAFDAGDGNYAWDALIGKPGVAEALGRLLERGDDLYQVLEGFAGRGRQLDHCFKRLAVLMELLDEFREARSGEFIPWLEIRGRGFLLHRTPLDVADEFRAHVDESGQACIFTSATLSVKGDFSHFAAQLGLDGIASMCWSSPFDYARQALLYVPPGMPDPRAEGYTEAAVERALPVLQLTRGRAFFLFTSYRALNIAAPLVRESVDFPVFVQGEAPRNELLTRFRGTPHAVLLGTSSFWEGVDVRGQALSCVIIDKLPFAAPDDPVLQARLKRMEEQQRNPFMEYQLPEAVIDLRQGIGRLIRDHGEYGVLMICDPRLLSKGYGRTFIGSMPQMPLTREVGDVGVFLESHEGATV